MMESEIVIDTSLESNWRTGNFVLKRINCQSENSKGVYCVQYDDEKIVSGLRDNTIKIWDKNTLQCTKVLAGHTGSVLCLQYDDKVIISGSSDGTLRIWNVATGEIMNTLIHHSESVFSLRFNNTMMVTSSKDRTIAVWDRVSSSEMNLRRVLVDHRASVNVVDFDDKYIVCASGDHTIKVWNSSSCEFVRTLIGHERGIPCLQYRDRLVVSGSSDNTIRIWDIENGVCLRVLEGHEDLVRCIRFDNKRIVSGSYDGTIKVWNLVAALDPLALSTTLCMYTLMEQPGKLFHLQFDDFQIISTSSEDTIFIWDFLNYNDTANTAVGPSNDAELVPHNSYTLRSSSWQKLAELSTDILTLRMSRSHATCVFVSTWQSYKLVSICVSSYKHCQIKIDIDSKKIAVCAVVTFLCAHLKKKKKSKIRWWTLSIKYYALNLLEDINCEPSGKFENFCRMSAEDLEFLLNKLGH